MQSTPPMMPNTMLAFLTKNPSVQSLRPAPQVRPRIMFAFCCNHKYTFTRRQVVTGEGPSPIFVKSKQETAPRSLRCRFPAANRVMIRNSSRSVSHAPAVFLRPNKSTSGVPKNLRYVCEAECPADVLAACLLFATHSIARKMARLTNFQVVSGRASAKLRRRISLRGLVRVRSRLGLSNEMKLPTKPLEKPCFVGTRSRLELPNETKLRTKPLEKPCFVRTRDL